jgi:hypothetical protein
MSINKSQFRSLIESVLMDLEEHTEHKIAYTDAAVELLMMTAAHESLLGYYIRQTAGPAVGPFQMEPFTHDDHWDYITPRHWLYTAFCKMNLEIDTDAEAMEYNLKYAIVMARIHYWRKPEGLPREDSPTFLQELSEYCKEHYNTVAGKATASKYLEDYYEYT